MAQLGDCPELLAQPLSIGVWSSATNNRQNWDRRANKTDSPDASEKACLTVAVYRAKLYDAKRCSPPLVIAERRPNRGDG